ncbi:uncharacterized protein LOC142589975 [Dermacentor variabilis]|uniref:uncharacterized protein LOC142589975 n=1 Tax=Dermacentor variabilis TaxID=34621 RepID=UPI003F5C1456
MRRFQHGVVPDTSGAPTVLEVFSSTEATCSNEGGTSIKQHTPRTKEKLLPTYDKVIVWTLAATIRVCIKHILVITGAPIYTNRKGLELNLQGFYTTNKRNGCRSI